MKNWYKIENKSDRAEIWIYEQIGEDWWTGEGVTAKSFQKDLATIKASQIDLHINSPGGLVFDGITIYNLLKQHPANITTYIDGLAASIASVIALAGDEVVMAENALFMVHNPFGMVMGNSNEMRAMADTLDKVRDSILVAYSSKASINDDEIVAMMDAETWMSAAEAKEAGFVDSIGQEMDMAACAKFIPIMAKAGFKQIPKSISSKTIPSPKDLEKALRDVGCSTKQAKRILAEGYPDFRDEDPEDPPPTQRDVEPKASGRIADRHLKLIKPQGDK